MTHTVQDRHKVKRSRNGCLSCKRLKIKCNEGKPFCEYCTHTKRLCIYPESECPKSKKKKKQLQRDISLINYWNVSSTDLKNKKLREINSLTHQLNVTYFELRLLKDFLRFGAATFSFNRNDKVYKFWSIEAPKLFITTELMRNAILAFSAMRLLTNFEENSIKNVCVSDDEEETLTVYQDPSLIKGQSISFRTNQYFQKASELMSLAISDTSTTLDDQISGQMLAVSIIIFVYTTIHPISPVPLISLDSNTVDLLQICLNFHKSVISRVQTIKNSMFECLIVPEDLKHFTTDSAEETKFAVIEFLKNYIDLNIDMRDDKYLVYYSAVSTFELGLYRSFKSGYMAACFRIILNMTRDSGFVKLLRSLDYVSLKIVFHLSCICSIGGFKFAKGYPNVWDSYLPLFKAISFKKFGNQFENEFDENMYYTTIACSQKKFEYSMDMLQGLGSDCFGSMEEKYF